MVDNQGMGDPVEITDHDSAWPREFAAIGAVLREALGDVAPRIDHIGSTSVPGPAAKPVIDIQISVRALEPLNAYKAPLERLGLVHRTGNPELTKRYFREAPGTRRTHIHVRELGSFSQQLPLLFRDYLRAHPAAATEFAQAKRECARRFRDDRRRYVTAKEPLVWDIVRHADAWAQSVGWRPGPSDA
nr:GrpB family protein [Planobispora longispora]